MNHYEDMRSKGGFGDGDNVSNSHFNIRSVYITTLNHLANKLGSNVRAVAWDRPGMHNPCMIVLISMDAYKKLGYDAPDANPSISKPEINGVLINDEPAYDEDFNLAEEIAIELELDRYLTQRGTLRKSLEKTLKAEVSKALVEHIG